METTGWAEGGDGGSGAQRHRALPVEEWLRKWSEGATAFHRASGHPLLQEHLDVLTSGHSGLRVFFPLCGKAVDMKWLADMGHSVVGVDVSEQALKEFFADQSLPYCEEPVPGISGAKKLQSTSGNICLYCCNIYDLSRCLAEGPALQEELPPPAFFTLTPFTLDYKVSLGADKLPRDCLSFSEALQFLKNPVLRLVASSMVKSIPSIMMQWNNTMKLTQNSAIVGKFDGVWDRGALVAVNPCDRPRYVSLLSSLMEKNSSYLLVTVLYDPNKHEGPPFYVPESEVKSLFGNQCEIKCLKKVSDFSDRHKQWGLDYFLEVLYVIKFVA